MVIALITSKYHSHLSPKLRAGYLENLDATTDTATIFHPPRIDQKSRDRRNSHLRKFRRIGESAYEMRGGGVPIGFVFGAHFQGFVSDHASKGILITRQHDCHAFENLVQWNGGFFLQGFGFFTRDVVR